MVRCEDLKEMSGMTAEKVTGEHVGSETTTRDHYKGCTCSFCLSLALVSM